MSLDALLIQTATVQRPVPTKDLSGGSRQNFTAVTGLIDIPCSVQPHKGKATRVLGQRQVFVTHRLYFGADFALLRGDRLYVNETAQTFTCLSSLMNFAGRSVCWTVDCLEET